MFDSYYSESEVHKQLLQTLIRLPDQGLQCWSFRFEFYNILMGSNKIQALTGVVISIEFHMK